MNVRIGSVLSKSLSKSRLCLPSVFTVIPECKFNHDSNGLSNHPKKIQELSPIIKCSAQPEFDGKDLEDSDMKDRIQELHDYLVSFAIPKFFAIRHPWAIYSKDIYFENRLWDEVETAKGIDGYAWKLMRFRYGSILSYARSKLEVIASRVEGQEITIHWRFSGLPQSTVFLAFWRFLPWKMKQAKRENSRVVEGISSLYVGRDKLIHKHIIDRLVLDPNLEESQDSGNLLDRFRKLRRQEAEKALS